MPDTADQAQLRHTFGWPQAVKRRTAAAYLDLSLAEFDAEVAGARLPRGFMLGRSLHWSRASIDEHLNRLSGDVTPDWRERSRLYKPSLHPAKGRTTRLATSMPGSV